jgi:hypothetical protein
MTGSHARLSPSTAGASAPDGEGNPGSLASYGIHDCRRKIGSSLRNYPAWFCRPDLFFMNVRIVTMRPYQVSLRSISFVALSAKKTRHRDPVGSGSCTHEYWPSRVEFRFSESGECKVKAERSLQ